MSQVNPTRNPKGYIDPRQVNRLINAATNPRDKAFASLLARDGVRVSEAIQSKVSDIDFEKRTLNIVHLKERAKLKCSYCNDTLGQRHLYCPTCGRKVDQASREKVTQRRQRVIPVDGITLWFIKEYLEWRSKFSYQGPLVFPFSRQRAWQLIEKLGRRIGISGLHPHSLRHMLATTWVAKGLDVKKLQVLLGHASIATTMEYVDSSFEQLKSEYDRLWKTEEDEEKESET